MFVVGLWYHKGMPRSEWGNVFPNIQRFSPISTTSWETDLG